jgi:hypothetical protein
MCGGLAYKGNALHVIHTIWKQGPSAFSSVDRAQWMGQTGGSNTLELYSEDAQVEARSGFRSVRQVPQASAWEVPRLGDDRFFPNPFLQSEILS